MDNTPLLAKALTTLPIALPTLLRALTVAVSAPLSLNASHIFLMVLVSNDIPLTTLLITLSISIPSKKLPNFSAIPSKLILSRAFATPEIALIPNLFNFWKAGCSLLASDSFAPSIAWSIDLNSVAIFAKYSLFPTFLIALKKSSVLTVPFCTA